MEYEDSRRVKPIQNGTLINVIVYTCIFHVQMAAVKKIYYTSCVQDTLIRNGLCGGAAAEKPLFWMGRKVKGIRNFKT